MKDSNELHVVYAADDNYAYLAGTSAFSLLTNNSSYGSVYVHILSDGISDDNVLRLKSLSDYPNTEVIIHDVNEKLELLKEYGIGRYGDSNGSGFTAYARILIPSILEFLRGGPTNTIYRLRYNG